MTFFCPLASGSKGNTVFVSYKNTSILIDAGITCRDLENRLKKIDKKLSDIDAILITHEHKDHIEGLKVICQKKKIPIICNISVAKAIHKYFGESLNFKIFTTDEPFKFQDIDVRPFTIQHDSIEPVGFIINTNIKIGFCSDVGFVSSLLKKHLRESDIVYVESNYDENMLISSRRPDILKRRIMGRQGHLSNIECVDLIESILHLDLKNIYLCHLSSECNRAELILNMIQNLLDKQNNRAKLHIAYQDRVSDSVCY